MYALIGKKLTEPEGEALGLAIMRKLNEYTAKWKAAENIDYSLYGTPLESTTYKFAKCLQKRFGVIPGVTDKGYITNSYHVHVTEPINAFDKLRLEAKFQKLSPGGAISYVEVPDMQNNLEAVLEVMKFIYDNIIYAELNTKSDYCQVCGWDGEIDIVEEGRQADLEVPAVRQHRPGQDERGPPHLRLHRHPVLEPGPHAGDQGARAAPVKGWRRRMPCTTARSKTATWPTVPACA